MEAGKLAKRRLKAPDVVPGYRRELFRRLQLLVLEHGDLPVVQLAAKIGVSHQTVYKALTGPRVPAERVVISLVDYLDSEAIDDVRSTWVKAVAEERDLRLRAEERDGGFSSNDVRPPETAEGGDPGQPDPRRIATRHEFAQELTTARVRAGLSVRQVATLAELPASTVGGYFAGSHLPALYPPTALRYLLRALGIRSETEVRAWEEALRRVRARSA